MQPRAVITAPCVSEFGWELMAFQGYVRKLAQNVDAVVVCSTDGLRPLYADMSPKFISHRVEGTRNCHSMEPCRTPDRKAQAIMTVRQCREDYIKRGYTVEYFAPKHGFKPPISEQVFVKYGDSERAKRLRLVYDVIVHARNRTDKLPCGGADYPKKLWDVVVALLLRQGLSVAAVGKRNAALLPDGVVDCRDADLNDVMDMMAAAKLVAGPSSGPMHLASLCGTPHFVWATATRQPVIGANNEKRYRSLWNPFKTPVDIILSKTPPTPSALLDGISKMLEMAR